MITPNDQPATMTVEQAGQLLGISRRSAYRAAAAGQLPTLRLGRRILVPTAALHRRICHGRPGRPSLIAWSIGARAPERSTALLIRQWVWAYQSSWWP